MIKRIVKMEFQPQYVSDFKQLFQEVQSSIESMPGCHSVELLTDIHNPGLMFTYSLWESEDALNTYRKSDLFSKTWKKTKAMFSGKAEAWSLENL